MDRVIETDSGFDCVVNGCRFGTWPNRGAAVAGMFTERRRALGKPAYRVTDEEVDAEIARRIAASLDE